MCSKNEQSQWTKRKKELSVQSHQFSRKKTVRREAINQESKSVEGVMCFTENVGFML